MSEIFVSTGALNGKESLSERIDLYTGHGISTIEFSGNVTVTDQDFSHAEGSEATFLLHNYFPAPEKSFVLNLASEDSEVVRQSRELVSNALQLCARFKIPFYSVHSGFVTDPTGFGTTSFIFPEPDSPDVAARATERFITQLKEILIEANNLGVDLIIENNVCPKDLKGKLLCNTADECLEVLEAIDDPRLGLLIDTGHLNVSAHTLEFDRLEFIQAVSKHIRAFHLHDNDGLADLHLPIQEGSWVFDALSLVNSDPVYIIESKFDSIEDLVEHRDLLRTLIA